MPICRFLNPILFVIFLLLVQCGSPDPDREANRLFVEAYRYTEEAREIERDDPVAAYEKYRGALANIDKIIESYSETQVAVNVTQQQTRVGELTIGELRRIVPVFQARARALESFHDLSRYLTGRIGDDVTKAEQQIRYARWVQNNDGPYSKILDEVAQSAHLHWNTEVSDPIYHQLTSAYASFGEWDKALEMADRIQDRLLLYHSLENIITGGYVRQAENGEIAPLLRIMDYVSPTEEIRLLTIVAEDLFDREMGEEAEAFTGQPIPGPEGGDELDHIDALTSLASMYATRGSFDASRSVISAIRDIDADYADFALRDLSIELARRQKMEEANEIVSGFERSYFRDTSIAGIAIQHARNGMVTDALEMLNTLSEELSETTNARIEIAYILADYGDKERSDSLLVATNPLLENINSALQQTEFRLRMVEIYLMRNERSQAAASLERTEETALQISGAGNRNLMLSEIISKWIQLGRPDRVLDIAAHLAMDHAGFRDIMTDLLKTSIQADYHDLAGSLALMTENLHYYRYYITGLYLESKSLERAANTSYDIRNYYWRAKALADLAHYLHLHGADTSTTSQKAASDALQTIQRIRSERERDEALEYAASRFAAANFTMNQELESLAAKLLGNIEM